MKNYSQATDEELLRKVKSTLYFREGNLRGGITLIAAGLVSLGFIGSGYKDFETITVAALAVGYAWLGQAVVASTFAEYLRRLNDGTIERIPSSSLEAPNLRNAFLRAFLFLGLLAGIYLFAKYR